MSQSSYSKNNRKSRRSEKSSLSVNFSPNWTLSRTGYLHRWLSTPLEPCLGGKTQAWSTSYSSKQRKTSRLRASSSTPSSSLHWKHATPKRKQGETRKKPWWWTSLEITTSCSARAPCRGWRCLTTSSNWVKSKNRTRRRTSPCKRLSNWANTLSKRTSIWWRCSL